MSSQKNIDSVLHQRQRLETLGRLSAGISHDFNNLLGAIGASSSHLRDLLDEKRLDPEVRECLDDIASAAQLASELTRRLLAFARANGTSSTNEVASVDAVVEEIVKLTSRIFDRRINIRTELEPGLKVRVSSVHLHQVLMNLLLNARDAILHYKERGHIVISSCNGSMVEIKISDDGCGMSLEVAQRAFEPFFTTKGPSYGFGLGLATVAELVQNHGGTIEVASKVGEGSIFTVRLPAEVEATSPVAPGQRRSLPPKSPLRVLLVDDEALLRRSIGRILRRAGFQVTETGSGEPALQIVAQQDVDVVLLDLDLPGISGEETLKRIKSIRPVPVVCITGHGDVEREQSARTLGASGYLTKPCEASILIESLLCAKKGASK